MNLPLSYPPARRLSSGLTLIEVTLVIATLLGLISVLFIGTGSYKEGSNSTVCVQTTASLQKAMRSYCNLHQIEPGQAISNLKSRIIQPEGFIRAEPVCPSGGTYTFVEGIVPYSGTLYITCSIPEHAPSNHTGW
jgi:competence protein ComGC